MSTIWGIVKVVWFLLFIAAIFLYAWMDRDPSGPRRGDPEYEMAFEIHEQRAFFEYHTSLLEQE